MWNESNGGGGPKKRGRPKKNPDLPGMRGQGVELPSIASIDKAIEEYVELRDQRMELTPKETAAKEKLLKLLKKHDLRVYTHDALVAEIVPEGETVKVKKAKASGEEE